MNITSIDIKKLYIETYGCQMNVSDSEVVSAILQKENYQITDKPEEADLILINTCSIRDNAEIRVKGRLENLRIHKKNNKNLKIGVLGCMAERIKDKILEDDPSVDLVVGPDAYRDLPKLLEVVSGGTKGVNTILSLEETYADISPVRLDENNVSAFVSIMRGCNNLCAYCVVPYTRGRERSRDPETILREVKELIQQGYKEVTLLGQNVNSYLWKEDNTDFPDLLEKVAMLSPVLRVRYSTSHPKDLSDKLIQVMSKYDTICKNVHLPIQSGSNNVLERMKRKYTRESYLQKISAIRKAMPEVSVSTDIITGFCGETEDDHLDTLNLMKEVGYDFAFMFKYSERPGTFAAKKYADDIPEETKTRRLNEIIELQNQLSLESKQKDIGEVFEVLIEGRSKKSSEELFGRTSQNKVVVFPKMHFKTGDYVQVKITDCSSATLKGSAIL
ncbi:MAG: tRNA (N6-isopentenyl adenosine(37)-C2)-methylthiotransferase MiaB [Bacteroidales bacterium]|nr:tRNA (N6-isopentenyl adenosine(37)-C2)-methylthiotransferase MiaB [Bacteroidales bacterium]MCF8391556.1 tRNA (N6-isopentenyl adenosine(37)-C2)-methylthiotransferase MiaB [Bacteroidales bacterium]